ncbi:hypothetical protein ACOMHN_064114 [Nucella lapillus]
MPLFPHAAVPQCRCSPMQQFPNAAVPPCRSSPMPLFPHATVPPCHSSPMPQFPHAPVSQCRCSPMPLFPHATVPPCHSSPMPQFSHATVSQCRCSPIPLFLRSCCYSRIFRALIFPTSSVCLFNAKSVGVARKRTAIADFLADHYVDVMVLTETWLKESGDESKIADLTPPGYKLFSFPRQLTASIKGGGGIAVIMKDCLASHTSINTTLSFTHTSFEVAELLLTVQRQRLRLLCVYR